MQTKWAREIRIFLKILKQPLSNFEECDEDPASKPLLLGSVRNALAPVEMYQADSAVDHSPSSILAALQG